MIVYVIIVNSVKGLKRWGGGGGERGEDQRVGQLPTDKGPEWMGFRCHEQNIGHPSKLGILLLTQGLINDSRTLCKY
jgi:hypothetical protein